MIELLSESLEGLSAAMIAELGRYRHQVFIEKLGSRLRYHPEWLQGVPLSMAV